MRRGFAGIVLGFSVVGALGWWAVSRPAPALAPPLAVEPVPTAAPAPAPTPTPPAPSEEVAAEAPPNPWAWEPPEAPARPADPSDSTWEAKREEAHTAWRERSLAAIDELSSGWGEPQRAAVVAATASMVDRIGVARLQTARGELTPSQLRGEMSEAREEADDAFRRASGEAPTAIWAALNAASAPQ